MATVVIGPEAQKQVEALPKVIRLRIRGVVAQLQGWPTVSGVTPLRGAWAGYYRKRTGDYRVIFRVDGDTVFIERVAHRREVYED